MVLQRIITPVLLVNRHHHQRRDSGISSLKDKESVRQQQQVSQQHQALHNKQVEPAESLLHLNQQQQVSQQQVSQQQVHQHQQAHLNRVAAINPPEEAQMAKKLAALLVNQYQDVHLQKKTMSQVGLKD